MPRRAKCSGCGHWSRDHSIGNPEYLRQMLTRTTVEWEHAKPIADDGSAEHPEDSLWAAGVQ
jgi:hypothetical protein